MKFKMSKDCIRVKMSKEEYNALVRLISLSHDYFMKRSISSGCNCAELAYFLFVQRTFEK